MTSEQESIFVGSIIDCIGDKTEDGEHYELRIFKKGFVAVRGNKIIGSGCKTAYEIFKRDNDLENANVITLSDTQILIPGLIDTHIHAPQYPNCGLGYDKPLMEWLQSYTYPLEMKYKDVDFATRVYDSVVQKTLSHGTTTACYFATMFTESCMVLVDIALKYGQRALVGKVNMQRLAPEDYTECHEDSVESTKTFVEYVLGKESDLVKPIITPRFAPSCENDLLKSLGELAQQYNLNIQSHISENLDEISLVKDLFNKNYSTVYDDAILLTQKTIMAHAVHLDDDDIKLFSEKQSAIAHCPQSNTNLHSGMCNVRRFLNAGVKVGLGTDISGGDSPSIVSAMRAALQVSIHLHFNDKANKPLDYRDVFYLATLGGAQALALDEKVGSFDIGKDFDALLVDANVENSACDFISYRDYDPSELLQKFIYSGDDRNVISVYVAGKKVK